MGCPRRTQEPRVAGTPRVKGKSEMNDCESCEEICFGVDV